MKLIHDASAADEFRPYVVVRSGLRHERHPLTLGPLPSPDPNELFNFAGPGLVDPNGQPTARGRATAEKAMAEHARATGSSVGMAWSPIDIVHIMPDGRTLIGGALPHSEPVMPADFERVPARTVNCLAIALPAPVGSSTHLCVRWLASDRVELSSGSPMILGRWDEAPIDGRRSVFEHCLDDRGRFVPPVRFRGQPVALERDGVLLGPVQPDGGRQNVVEPWPDLIDIAASSIIGKAIPDAMLERIWAYLNPGDINLVGVSMAA